MQDGVDLTAFTHGPGPLLEAPYAASSREELRRGLCTTYYV